MSFKQEDVIWVISNFFSWARDAAIVYAIFKGVWAASTKWQHAKEFFAAIRAHMLTMESFAKVVVDNHFHNLERDVATLVKREQEQ